MDKQDIRYTAAGILLVIGFMLVVGTMGKYDFQGYINASEFIVKTVIGIALMAVAVPVSGDFNGEEDKRDD